MYVLNEELFPLLDLDDLRLYSIVCDKLIHMNRFLLANPDTYVRGEGMNEQRAQTCCICQWPGSQSLPVLSMLA
jgi:hypothetical protein